MMSMNPYQVLGVAHDATLEQIKEARNFLASGLHPDRFETGSKHWQMANEKLKEINEAYRILSNSELRSAYDQQEGASQPETPENAEPSSPESTVEEKHPFMTGKAWGFAIVLLAVGAFIIANLRNNDAEPPEPSASLSGSSDGLQNIGTEKPASPPGPVPAGELKGHTGRILSLAVSADGQRAVSGSEDRTIRFWDTMEQKLLETAAVGDGFDNTVWSVALSPDGKFLLAGLQRAVVEVREVPSLKLIRQLRGHTSATYCVAISPDGRWAAGACYDHTATVWEIETGKMIKQVRHAEQVKSVSFSPDGRWLATASRDKTARVIDTKTWSIRHDLKGHKAPVHGTAFSPDSLTLASSSEDGTVRLWELASGRATHSLTLENDSLGRVTFSTDGTRVLAGSDRGQVVSWDIKTASPQVVWTAMEGRVGWVSVVPRSDFLLTAGGAPFSITRWNLKPGPAGK